LQALDAGNVPVELKPIVGDTNRLLSRLRKALDAERAFAANWAHELRNPVAAARAQTELIARSFQGPERSHIDVLVETLQNLSQRVERLLQKSRAESGASSGSDASDAIAVAELVIDSYYYLPGDRRLALDDGGIAAMPVTIDQDALAIILQNLIDNAVANSPQESVVQILISPDAEIHVINDCPIVPAEELARIRSRFQRGSGAAHGGFGLGLSIVQQILGQSGGSLDLKSPATGQSSGFEAVVRLRRA
jgi:two-component system OmpR family sensor kinase